jgi:hypothetical protein
VTSLRRDVVDELVRAPAAGHLVRAGTAEQQIVAFAAKKKVVAAAAVEPVGAAEAIEHVGALVPDMYWLKSLPVKFSAAVLFWSVVYMPSISALAESA